jgi:hypothetical protein
VRGSKWQRAAKNPYGLLTPPSINMGFLSRLFGEGYAKERQRAQELGITAADVERELPYFSAPNTLDDVSLDLCVRYAVPRRGFVPRVSWSLLQRTPAQGAQLPNGYLLVADGEIASALHEQLRAVAEEYDEELFEFEGTENEVAVYWHEWGGNVQVEKLHRYLMALAAY